MDLLIELLLPGTRELCEVSFARALCCEWWDASGSVNGLWQAALTVAKALSNYCYFYFFMDSAVTCICD